MLATNEIRIILDTLNMQYGVLCDEKPEIGKLQAKLSTMLEVKAMAGYGVKDKCVNPDSSESEG